MPSRAIARSWAPPTPRRPPRGPSARTTRSASSRTWSMDRMRPRPLRRRSRTSSGTRSCTRAARGRACPMTADPAPSRENLLGLTRPALESFVTGLGSRPFRARQLMNWVYKRGEGSFESMTDLAKDFRAQLAARAHVRPPEIVSVHSSSDGTRKWLLRADASQAFEMVFIPEDDRGTLCISSQVGCALDCSFCSTGQQGFNRNLTAAEIVGQVWLAKRELGEFSAALQPIGERSIVT